MATAMAKSCNRPMVEQKMVEGIDRKRTLGSGGDTKADLGRALYTVGGDP